MTVEDLDGTLLLLKLRNCWADVVLCFFRLGQSAVEDKTYKAARIII